MPAGQAFAGRRGKDLGDRNSGFLSHPFPAGPEEMLLGRSEALPDGVSRQGLRATEKHLLRTSREKVAQETGISVS